MNSIWTALSHLRTEIDDAYSFITTMPNRSMSKHWGGNGATFIYSMIIAQRRKKYGAGRPPNASKRQQDTWKPRPSPTRQSRLT